MNAPKPERSYTMAKQKNSTPSGTVFGNLGGDPKVFETKESTYTFMAFDPILEEMVEREGTRQAGEFRTFSIAIQEDGMESPYWLQCVDWNNLSKMCRKGDRVKLTGRLEDRTYTDKKTQEEKTVRQLVVETLSIQSAKVRTKAA
jgi:single-stranded DNA-binding protein